MGGSRLPNPVTILAMAMAAIAGLALALPARAAELDQPASLGQPIVLFSPNARTPPLGFLHDAATTSAAAKRSAVQRAPLIPPAPLPTKLGPPPSPRPALPLDTDLQPLAPPQSAGSGLPPGAKSPAG